MRVFVLLFTVALVCVAASCSKSINRNNTGNNYSGKWSIIVDSFPEGGGASAHITAYKGQKGDYYDFNADGFLYVKEGANQYKYSYQFAPDLSIVTLTYPDSSAAKFTFSITSTLDTRQMNLLNRWLYSPGGPMGRSVELIR